MAEQTGNTPVDEGLKSTSASAVAAITLADQLFQSLSRVAQSPQQLSLALAGVGKMITDHYIKNLEKSGKLTREMQTEINTLVNKRNGILLLGQAFSQVSFYVGGVARELKQAQIELKTFTNLSTMPGGKSNLRGSNDYLMGLKAQNLSQYTVEYASSVEEVRKRLNMKLPTSLGFERGLRDNYSGSGLSEAEINKRVKIDAEKQRDEYISRVALYNMSSGVQTEGFLENITQNQAQTGIGYIEAQKILGELLGQSNQGKFGSLAHREVLDVFSRQFSQLTSGPAGMTGNLAMEQIFNLMETGAGNRMWGTNKSMPLGTGDLDRLSKISTMFQGGAQGQVLNQLTGGYVKQGTGSTGYDIIASLQEFLRNQVRNSATRDAQGNLVISSGDFKTTAELFNKNFQKYANLVGVLKGQSLDEADLRLLLNSDLGGMRNSTSQEALNIIDEKDALASSKAAVKNLEEIKTLLQNMKGLTEFLQYLKVGMFRGLNQVFGEGNATQIMDMIGMGSGLIAGISGTAMGGYQLMQLKQLIKNTSGSSGVGAPTSSMIVDASGKPYSTAPTGVKSSTFGKFSKYPGLKWGLGSGAMVGGLSTLSNLAEGEDLGTSAGRGLLTAGGVLGGTILGTKIGTALAPATGGVSIVAGMVLGAVGGYLSDLIGREILPGKESDEDLSSYNGGKDRGEIRVIITDDKNKVIADKIVPMNNGQPVVAQWMTGGVLTN